MPRDQEIQIRRGSIEDTEGVIAALRSFAEEESHAIVDGEQLKALVIECIRAPSSELYVAVSGGAVLGYAVVHWLPFPLLGGREGYVSDVVVLRSHRGQEIGSRLVECIEGRAKVLGCIRLMLNNRVASEGYRRNFYKKQGFIERDGFANFVKRLS